MHPLFYTFKHFFNNTSLLAFDNKKVLLTDKKWVNLINGHLKFNQKFKTTNINTNVPIAIIIGKNTCSTGEFVASAFLGSPYVKFFGHNSSGFLSGNKTYNINKYILILTEILTTTKIGKFQEYLEPDIYTENPIDDAKFFINNFKI